MSQADRSTSTTSPESERRVPRWPADDGHIETEISRLFTLWQAADERSKLASERYEAIRTRISREGPAIPMALRVHRADVASNLVRHSKPGPGGIQWFSPDDLETFRGFCAGKDAIIAARCEEIVAAARKYLDDFESIREELGFYEASREDTSATAHEKLLRIQIVVLPSRTFADLFWKARIAERCIGDVDEELLSHFNEGSAGDAAFQVSILRDVLAFAR